MDDFLRVMIWDRGAAILPEKTRGWDTVYITLINTKPRVEGFMWDFDWLRIEIERKVREVFHGNL